MSSIVNQRLLEVAVQQAFQTTAVASLAMKLKPRVVSNKDFLRSYFENHTFIPPKQALQIKHFLMSSTSFCRHASVCLLRLQTPNTHLRRLGCVLQFLLHCNTFDTALI